MIELVCSDGAAVWLLSAEEIWRINFILFTWSAMHYKMIFVRGGTIWTF